MTRRITEEENALWKLATKEVSGVREGLDDFIPRGVTVKITPDVEIKTSKRHHIPHLMRDLFEKTPHQVRGVLSAMERKKLATGKTRLDARLDLHGMWLNEAQRAVISFVLDARESGKRRLLIITGKGGIDSGGRIRTELPLWLQDEKLRTAVSAVSESAPRHGGSGAFYVTLKKH